MKTYWARFFKEADGAYSADVPDLPGCLTCGDSIEEAYRYLVDEAIPLWLEGQVLPEANAAEAVLAAPSYEGAPKPVLARVTVGDETEAETLAEALAQAARNDLLAQAARDYLARHQGNG